MHLPQQRGAFLIALMAMIGLVFLASLVANLPDKRAQAHNQETTAQALAQAKAALIGYALTYLQTHPSAPIYENGYFPCPDIDGDGIANDIKNSTECYNKGHSVMGRLPWKTLGLGPLRDGSGELLWYVISGEYKANASTKAYHSSDDEGHLTVKDERNGGGEYQAIALVFAPGAAIDGQIRVSPGDADYNDSSRYLDIYSTINNADGTDSSASTGDPGLTSLLNSSSLTDTESPLDFIFVNAPHQATDTTISFNDDLIAITLHDIDKIYPKMEDAIAQEVKTCIQAYLSTTTVTGHNRYPWPAALTDVVDGIYNDVQDNLFGRIPEDLTTTHTNNTAMPATWASGCFAQDVGWWDYWKELIFIAIKKNYGPTEGGTGSADLRLDESDKEFIILIAGKKLSWQHRETTLDKSDILNYLEGENADSDARFITGQITDTFNDTAFGM